LKSQAFIVDASLLRELGERLIGRAHIALAELVKNAYDADATICRITFEEDQITVFDNGTGMSEEDFLNHWMRIATTHKVEQRVSQLGRPLTGSKGIGRLSVQFLADEMILESVTEKQPDTSIYAYVDWRHALSGNDLSSVNVLWDTPPAMQVNLSEPSGTRITLKSLKSAWSTSAIGDLGNDVWMLRSPFRRAGAARQLRIPENFDVEIEALGITNAKEAFDESMRIVFSNWRARIRGSLEHGRSGGKASIVAEFKAGYPDKSDKDVRFQEVIDVPVLRADQAVSSPNPPVLDTVQFEILIFRPEGIQPGGIPVATLREYLDKYGNVSVYDAGFRLPYYGSTNNLAGHDWLSIALDQGRRVSISELLPKRLNLRPGERYMLDLPAPGRIFGAVDIDTNHERTAAENDKTHSREHLQIQPGRDRLHSNLAFDQLRNLVRFSLDFYANRFRMLAFDSDEEDRAREPPSRKFSRVLDVLKANERSIPAEVLREVRREVVDAQKATATEERALDQRAALLAPLAAAGMAALALNHEIAREVRMLDRVSARLRQIATDRDFPELLVIADEFTKAKSRLDSLQELFSPLLSDIDTAASNRLRVRPVVEQVIRSMQSLMPRVIFRTAGIPTDLRFPLGSLAEWNAILQNVLANAWNAMLDSAEFIIAFEGSREGNRREWLKISDTGKGLGLPVSDTSQLFEPFERRLSIAPDKRSIAIGGQGLGLTIVRMIAHRRSADVTFVEPPRGFSTTFEISWRGASK
jgi:signal transduction histidine kinase